MDKPLSVEEFYRTKLNWMPEGLKKEIGHFNVFSLDDFKDKPFKHTAYSRQDFFKISLMNGKGRLQYANREIVVDGHSLFFGSALVPYHWEPFETHPTGFFCIFTEAFFDHFGSFKEYPVFKPGANPVYSLTDEQAGELRAVYTKMQREIVSDYIYKYDVLRTLVFELIHTAMRLQPAAVSTFYQGSNANTRVSSLFTELLERQFPIETPRQQVKFRTPAEFALQLSIHVNHLNRALKEMTGKTTSQLISERVTQEAKALLRHTDWNISEIAWCLGFEELPHFIHFFRKGAEMTPGSFRGSIV